MKLGIIISQQEAETVWNAFRLGNFSLDKKHKVKVFLIGKGVGYENVADEKFNVKEQAKEFVDNNGEIFACGSCLKLRNLEGSPLCPISSMQELMNIVEESDKIVSF